MKRVISFVFVIVFVLMCTCGCSGNKSTVVEQDKDVYSIYYLNHDKNMVIQHQIKHAFEDKNMLFEALLEDLKNAKSKTEISIFSYGPMVFDYSFNDRVLQIYFTEDYYKMDSISEIMFRCAIVKTFSQMNNIDYVMFFVGEQPLMTSNGTLVGLMNSASFIDDNTESTDTVKWLETTLYYASRDGKSLCGETTKLAYSKIAPIEQVIVERLIDGPDIIECNKAIPSDVRLIKVSIKDDICYVNFDANFANGMAEVIPEVTFFSIVNSLCELKNINKVQIMINGSQDGTYRETFVLANAYERNLDLVTEVYTVYY